MWRVLAALAPGAAGLLLLAGCTAPAPAPPPALWLVERVVVHCYRTLAEPECTPTPQPGEGRRLIGAAPTLRFRPL